MPKEEKPAGQDTPKPTVDDTTKNALKAEPEGAAKKEEPKVDDSPKPEDKPKEEDAPKPKAPVKYELQRPEDELFTDADLSRIEATARAMDLTQEQAQALIDGEMTQLGTLRSSFLADLKADKEIGGDQLDASVALAKVGVKAFLKDSPQDEQTAVMNLLDKSGYGNHKALVRAFARLGKMMREDNPDSGGKGGAKAEESLAKSFYGVD